jgi:hypothetical protein
MRRRITLLHTPVVPRAQKPPVGGKQRGTDRDTALGQSRARFGDRGLKHLSGGSIVHDLTSL